MTAHEVLVAARNLIDRDGWCRGSRGTGPWCLEGALGAVQGIVRMQRVDGAGTHPHYFWIEQTEAFDVLQRALRGRRPYYWNDDRGRTKQEVFDLLDSAIAATAPAPPFDQLDVTPRADASVSIKEEVSA